MNSKSHGSSVLLPLYPDSLACCQNLMGTSHAKGLHGSPCQLQHTLPPQGKSAMKVLKNYVRPLPTWKRSIYPVNAAFQNVQTNFVVESRFTLELVWREVVAMIWNTTTSAINTDVTIMAWINDHVIKFDLERIFCCLQAMNKWSKGGHDKTNHNLLDCWNCWDKWPDLFMSSLWANNSFWSTFTRTHNPMHWINFEIIQSTEHVVNGTILREKVNIGEQFPKSNRSHHTNTKKLKLYAPLRW